jgi:hypothetical protein
MRLSVKEAQELQQCHGIRQEIRGSAAERSAVPFLGFLKGMGFSLYVHGFKQVWL